MGNPKIKAEIVTVKDIKSYWRMKVRLHAFLTSAVEVSDQHHAPAAFLSGKGSSISLCTE
jgi:hypothetical protein